MSILIAFGDDLEFRARRIAFSDDLCRYVSHLRMTCFYIISCSSPFAVSYRHVHGIRVSTHRTSLCTVFASIAFSTFASYRYLHGIRTSTRRTSLCAVFDKHRFRLRQAQNRMQQIDTSRTICSSLAAALKRERSRVSV